VGRDEPERASLGVDRSAVYRVCHENFRVRHARVQFGKSEDYFVTVLSFGNHVRGHQFSAKLASLSDARSSELLLQKNSLVGFRFVLMGICNMKSGAGHVFQVGGSQSERSRNRAANFELRGGGGSLGYCYLAKWENGQEGTDGKDENGSSAISIHAGSSRLATKCLRAYCFSIIISVDLITAETVSPTFRFISTALRRVITLSM
jgi:hypothetical protein